MRNKTLYIVMITLIVALFASSCRDNINDPEKLALAFLEGNIDGGRFAPDGKYESIDYRHPDYLLMCQLESYRDSECNPFEFLWGIRNDERSEYQYEIHDVIVRDSSRPNSKEVTIFYEEKYWDIQPPWFRTNMRDLTVDDLAPVSFDQWQRTGEFITREQVAFFVIEKLDQQWVIWCAELEPHTIFLPDVCGF